MNGISHQSLVAGTGLAASLEMAAELGFTTVEHVRAVGQSGPPHPTRAWYRDRRITLWAVTDMPDLRAPSIADPADGRGRAWQSRVLALRDAANALGCRQMLVDAGSPAASAVAQAAGDLALAAPRSRERLLDSVCRNLHAVLRQLGDQRLALVPTADVDAVPGPTELELVLDDLGDPRLGYCFATDTCALLAARGAGAMERWLEADRTRLVGARVADLVGERTGALPGTGRLDWTALAAELRGLPAILRVDREVAREELLVVQRFMAGVGL